MSKHISALCQTAHSVPGVLVVNNYQILLYKSLGITGSLPLLLNALYNALAAFMNFINSLFLDRLGRIRIMLIGLVSLGIPTRLHTLPFFALLIDGSRLAALVP